MGELLRDLDRLRGVGQLRVAGTSGSSRGCVRFQRVTKKLGPLELLLSERRRGAPVIGAAMPIVRVLPHVIVAVGRVLHPADS